LTRSVFGVQVQVMSLVNQFVLFAARGLTRGEDRRRGKEGVSLLPQNAGESGTFRHDFSCRHFSASDVSFGPSTRAKKDSMRLSFRLTVRSVLPMLFAISDNDIPS